MGRKRRRSVWGLLSREAQPRCCVWTSHPLAVRHDSHYGAHTTRRVCLQKVPLHQHGTHCISDIAPSAKRTEARRFISSTYLYTLALGANGCSPQDYLEGVDILSLTNANSGKRILIEQVIHFLLVGAGLRVGLGVRRLILLVVVLVVLVYVDLSERRT
ncbi:unnamed protein product [Ixodes persulcatus]